MLGLAAVLMVAGVAAAAPTDGTGPHISTDGGMTLQLTSTMPGVTFNGTTLVCPPMLIAASSGENLAACEFTISSTGAVAPGSLAVSMSVSGLTPAELAADKFAIAPGSGPLVHPGTTPQTIYTFTGADLPVTVSPGVAWGTNAGTALDNSDMGASIAVTYTVVAESLEGATATPVSTRAPGEIVEGATGAPVQAVTPPPTASSSGSSGTDSSTPPFVLLICLVLAGLGLSAVEYGRRSVRR